MRDRSQFDRHAYDIFAIVGVTGTGDPVEHVINNVFDARQQ
jgi:hypothetical protein